jgi:hypothetical protein
MNRWAGNNDTATLVSNLKTKIQDEIKLNKINLRKIREVAADKDNFVSI